ncbi:MAG: hypothetical protein ACKVKL_07825 [Pseudomonadales bacterium]|jgi:hypothetical protein|tara:strand:- start:737 stop:1543 length:807 start_codon:yes stop_codon:yes gene_type:complete
MYSSTNFFFDLVFALGVGFGCCFNLGLTLGTGFTGALGCFAAADFLVAAAFTLGFAAAFSFGFALALVVLEGVLETAVTFVFAFTLDVDWVDLLFAMTFLAFAGVFTAAFLTALAFGFAAAFGLAALILLFAAAFVGAFFGAFFSAFAGAFTDALAFALLVDLGFAFATDLGFAFVLGVAFTFDTAFTLAFVFTLGLGLALAFVFTSGLAFGFTVALALLFLGALNFVAGVFFCFAAIMPSSLVILKSRSKSSCAPYQTKCQSPSISS